MKRLGMVLLAVFAAASVQSARADDKTAAKDDKADGGVMKADKAFTAAIAKGDSEAFDKLTSGDYILTSSRGNVWDKAKNLDALKDGTLKFDSIDNEDEKVHKYGDAAVVTGLSKIKGHYKDKEFDDSYRWTRVWVHHEGSWVCVAEQMSLVAPPADTTKPKEK